MFYTYSYKRHNNEEPEIDEHYYDLHTMEPISKEEFEAMSKPKSEPKLKTDKKPLKKPLKKPIPRTEEQHFDAAPDMLPPRPESPCPDISYHLMMKRMQELVEENRNLREQLDFATKRGDSYRRLYKRTKEEPEPEHKPESKEDYEPEFKPKVIPIRVRRFFF